MYTKKKVTAAKYECPTCRKNFRNQDYLEFHLKQFHFEQEKVTFFSEKDGKELLSLDYDICLSDYCDIFEC